MSQKKKIKIITGIIGAATLTGDGIINSATTIIPKIEEKTQEENETNNQQNLKKQKLKLNIRKVKRSPNDEKLINIIQNTNLGNLPNNKINTILQAVLRQHPNIDISRLRVGTVFSSSAVISGYNDRIFVNFLTNDIRSSTNIRNNIQNTNLGNLPNNSNETIANRILELNRNIIRNSFRISEITNNSALIINKNDKNDKLYFNFHIVKKIFKTRIRNTNLGVINFHEDEEKIKNAIIQENPDIDKNELEIIKIEVDDKEKKQGSTAYRVSVISITELDEEFNSPINTESFVLDEFIERNQITFNFVESTTDQTNDNNNLLENTNLGNLPNNQPQTILDAILNLNPELDANNLNLLNIGERSATVTIDQSTSSATNLSSLVHFTVYEESGEENNICHRIKQMDLGKLQNDNLSTIKNKICSLMPDIDKNKLTIVSRTPTKIIITSPRERICIGGSISFSVNENAQINSLQSIIINRNLGQIPNNSNFSILQAVLRKNPNIDINSLRVESSSENSAIIIGRLRSPYQGSTVVNFTIRKKIAKTVRFNNNPVVNVAFIKKYNSIPKDVKKDELKKFTDQFKNFNIDHQKKLQNEMNNLGIGLINAGLTGTGIIGLSKMTGISPIQGLKDTARYVASKITSTSVTTTNEAVELTPLLAEEQSLNNVVETISVGGSEMVAGEAAVGSGVIAGEAAVGSGVIAAEAAVGSGVIAAEAAVGSGVIAAEAAASLACAPETLGLSLIVGAIITLGTAAFWWLNSDNKTEITTSTKHEASNMYDISTIEKYYKLLAYDQIKLSINPTEWNNIRQIFQNNLKNYDQFLFLVKDIFTELHKEDHSGFFGAISNNDINTLIRIIFNHFQEINDHFLFNPKSVWKIVTNTNGSYFYIQ